MFASINLDGATESAGKQVLTRDGTAAPASHIEINRAITAPDVRCLRLMDAPFRRALLFNSVQREKLSGPLRRGLHLRGSRHPLWVFSLLDGLTIGSADGGTRWTKAHQSELKR
jgi:hypothetical protein